MLYMYLPHIKCHFTRALKHCYGARNRKAEQNIAIKQTPCSAYFNQCPFLVYGGRHLHVFDHDTYVQKIRIIFYNPWWRSILNQTLQICVTHMIEIINETKRIRMSGSVRIVSVCYLHLNWLICVASRCLYMTIFIE